MTIAINLEVVMSRSCFRCDFFNIYLYNIFIYSKHNNTLELCSRSFLLTNKDLMILLLVVIMKVLVGIANVKDQPGKQYFVILICV